ncbi:DUF3461 family protein [Motiliproteus coralliicola]|uniref:DUF3461 family protein n=1 Tax=Motiliproteus coralliicola TaxID=2283196 RepID=A0A369WS27_9GAMM|nr:DUF3461 family protein [Motiliproteus coralliicola]RDE24920.1 DUF3461 family protein [Motiliproteus coralliicola]
MSSYPTLTEMGIPSVDEIYKYSLRQEGDVDVLKVYFRREKGSLLPRSKKFKFGRSHKTVRVDSSHDKYQEISEMSAFLMKAIDELHELVQHEHEVQDIRERLHADIDHLEKVVSNKLADIRRDIDKIK